VLREPHLDQWAGIAARLSPAGRLAGTWSFAGGLSSAMTVLEIDDADRARRRFVVRRRDGARRRSIGREHRVIERLHALGIPVPPPVELDESGALLAEPFAVYHFVEGAPRLSTTDPAGTGRIYARHLAAIHAVDLGHVADLRLPDRADAVLERLDERPAAPDTRLREPAIRLALHDRRDVLATGGRRLLHGDYWPGNVLFADGDGDRVAAIIDWEFAGIGDPLADVAGARLDLWWAHGPEAMTAFTEDYLARTGADPARLAVWELVAALRPCGFVSSWAADWGRQGRPDITPAFLRAVHLEFLDRALAALPH
jgi:aminoglycoside phosphotransferase (APT) family kinase protein